MDARQTQIKSQLDKSRKVVKLLENELFNEIIIEDFIKGGVLDNALKHSLDSSKTIDELKARQILHEYIFGIIMSAETVQN